MSIELCEIRIKAVRLAGIKMAAHTVQCVTAGMRTHWYKFYFLHLFVRNTVYDTTYFYATLYMHTDMYTQGGSHLRTQRTRCQEMICGLAIVNKHTRTAGVDSFN